jgi:hypothetical protein
MLQYWDNCKLDEGDWVLCIRRSTRLQPRSSNSSSCSGQVTCRHSCKIALAHPQQQQQHCFRDESDASDALCSL